MEHTLNHGMCRCCASEGMFKNFSATYQWMGADEVYADMLKECFDITLTTAEDYNNGGICEVCITQLRNASNFKKQVLQTEEQFKKTLQDDIFKTSIVKEELNKEEGDYDSDNNISEDFSGTEYEVPIKEELSVEPKAKKRSAKASTSSAKRAKKEDGEPSNKRIVRNVSSRLESSTASAVTLVKAPIKRMTKISRQETMDDIESISKPSQIISKQDLGIKTSQNTSKRTGGSELQKHLENIEEILQWSNATPIRCRGGIGYACSYCDRQFPNPADLKNHTIVSHAGLANAYFTKKRDMTGFVIKIDITGLCCKICFRSIESLDALIDHLIAEHCIKLHTDIKNHMLPFKFNGDELRCFICHNEYRTFKMLLEHMSSVHSRNFICDVCDAGFINLRKLVTHAASHETGIFQCSFCDKVFMTLKKKKSHEVCVHTRPKVYRCGYCQESFKFHFQKERHLAEAHGAQIPKIQCSVCKKEFTTQSSYSVHTRRHHLLERKHACEECSMMFFSSTDLKDHMQKHTGVKNFECKICSKRYSRKSTLKEHMRIHADDRSYVKQKDSFLKLVAIKGGQSDDTKMKTIAKSDTTTITSLNIPTKKVKKVEVEKPTTDLTNENEKKPQQNKRMERMMLTVNAIEVLSCSNATVIHNRGRIGYSCSFCPEEYPIPADLKRHNLDEHSSADISDYIDKRSLTQFYIKVDITGLQCKICSKSFETLDVFMAHLCNDHDKKIFMQAKGYMVPFKFDGYSLECFICLHKFIRFKGLLEHMNTHYRNFVCAVCDAGFITRSSMASHSKRHDTGKFWCKICDKVFSTLSRMKAHERYVHAGVVSNKCGYCNQSFRDYNQKNQHLREVHGLVGTVKCSACDRTFTDQRAYRIHIKRDHLMEREFKCTVCDYKFYRQHDLKHHMVKHTRVRKFQCDVCLKTYGRKSTLRAHVRIHADDRRFKCEHCGMAFVQKCSWRGHLRAKHGEII